MQKIMQFFLVLLLWLSVNVANVHADQVTDLQNIKFTNNTQIDFNARKFVDAYLQIWNDQKLDQIGDYYTEDIVYKDMPLETTSKGIKELKPEKIAVKWLMTGSEDGKPFETEGVSIMELKQGKVFKNTDYYN